MVLRYVAIVEKYGGFFVFERVAFFVVFLIDDFVVYVGGGAVFLSRRAPDQPRLQ